jgi:hypothetical protein
LVKLTRTVPVVAVNPGPVLGNVTVAGFGVTDIDARVATPVPVNVTDAGVMVAPVADTASVRETDPTVVGANCTRIEQEVPAASVPVTVVGQVPPFLENGCGVPPPNVYANPVNGELPVLRTLTASVPLVVPVAQMPKASGLGPMLAVKVRATELPVN